MIYSNVMTPKGDNCLGRVWGGVERRVRMVDRLRLSGYGGGAGRGVAQQHQDARDDTAIEAAATRAAITARAKAPQQ